MKARLKSSESPGHGFQRVCRRHLHEALAGLRKTNQPETVHAVRKEIKKLRALFRLTGGALPRKDYRRASSVMRRAAKPLAPLRDARVIQRTLATLAGPKARQFPEIRSALETSFCEAERSFSQGASGTVAQHRLRKACTRLERMKIKRIRWSEIKISVQESYARGQRAWRLAIRKPAPEQLHEWRKRVKDLGYQLDFLCPRWPARTRKLLAGLVQLGERLGDDHDLALLEAFAKAQGVHRRETETLQEYIAARRKRSAAGIRQLGLRLYAKAPEAAGAQLEQDWKAWRKGLSGE